jgi:hypothetical protein
MTEKPIIPIVPPKPFSGRAYVVRGLWFRQKCIPAGTVIECSAEEFQILAASTRCVEFDPTNPAHAAALTKLLSAHGGC